MRATAISGVRPRGTCSEATSTSSTCMGTVISINTKPITTLFFLFLSCTLSSFQDAPLNPRHNLPREPFQLQPTDASFMTSSALSPNCVPRPGHSASYPTRLPFPCGTAPVCPPCADCVPKHSLPKESILLPFWKSVLPTLKRAVSCMANLADDSGNKAAKTEGEAKDAQVLRST